MVNPLFSPRTNFFHANHIPAPAVMYPDRHQVTITARAQRGHFIKEREFYLSFLRDGHLVTVYHDF